MVLICSNYFTSGKVAAVCCGCVFFASWIQVDVSAFEIHLAMHAVNPEHPGPMVEIREIQGMTKMHELHDPIRSHCFTTIYLLYFWPRLTSCKIV